MQTAARRFLQYLEVERNASALTIKSYREDLEALIDYLTQCHGQPPRPEQITTPDLRGYLAALHEAEYAKTTIARRLASLRSFFRFGQREGWAQANPAKPLRNPRKPRSLPHFLSSDDMGRLLGVPATAAPMGLRDRAILEVLYSAGLRVSELAGLNDGDIDLAAGAVRVRGKGKRERIGPIGSFALGALRQWLDVRELSPRIKPGPGVAGVRQQVRQPADDPRHRPDVGKAPAGKRPRPPHHAAYAPPQLCHALARPWGRHPQRARAARSQEPDDHADLYARQHRRPARRLRACASAGEVGAAFYTSPLRTAQTAAWVRSVAAILRRMFCTCSLTVSMLMASERPISLLLKPKATCRKTCVSRSRQRRLIGVELRGLAHRSGDPQQLAGT